MCPLPEETIFLPADEWKETVDALKRVYTFCNDAIEYGQYIIRAEDVLKALKGEQE